MSPTTPHDTTPHETTPHDTTPPVTTPPVTTLVHNRIRLALHELRGGEGRALLLLHGLGERSPATVPDWAEAWAGPVVALDFTGHGASTVPRGGGYSAEILLADADTALGHLGEVTVVGRGLGAYVALQLAGARPDRVHGAVLCDGAGLPGGAVGMSGQRFFSLVTDGSTPDPYALVELSRDLRPPDYATMFVRLAVQGSALTEPISVAAVYRPPWLAAVVGELGVVESSIDEALSRYA
jgi:pimeloyl-ACP methyl ester carboxylesterase